MVTVCAMAAVLAVAAVTGPVHKEGPCYSTPLADLGGSNDGSSVMT